jgi:hypothetical protein
MPCNVTNPKTAVDFEDCSQKKCSTSDGSAIFDCDSPCEEGSTFDYSTGICDNGENSNCYDGKPGTVTWTFTTTSYTWAPCTAVGCTIRCNSLSQWYQCETSVTRTYSIYVPSADCFEVRGISFDPNYCDLPEPPCNYGKFISLYNGSSNLPLASYQGKGTCGVCQQITGMTIEFEEDCGDNSIYNPDTCECEPSFRKYRYVYDNYCQQGTGGGFGFNGQQCCQGYTLNSTPREIGPNYRDWGTAVTITGVSTFGNTKLGWSDAQGNFNACRANEELTYADAGYEGSYVESGPFGSFGSLVAADQKVYQQAGASGGCTTYTVVEAETVTGDKRFMTIANGICGSVECAIPDCNQNIRAIPINPDTGDDEDEIIIG